MGYDAHGLFRRWATLLAQTVAFPLYLYLRRLWGDDRQEVIVMAAVAIASPSSVGFGRVSLR